MKNHPIERTRIGLRFSGMLKNAISRHFVGTGRAGIMRSDRKPRRAVTLACLGMMGISMATADRLHAATQTRNLSANESITISAGNSVDVADSHGVVADGVRVGNIDIGSDGAIRIDATNDSANLGGVRILATDNGGAGAARIANSGVITVTGKLGDATGVGFDGRASGDGNSTVRVNNFTNQGAITVTAVADNSYAYASGVDFLALTEGGGNASLRADNIINGKNAAITVNGNGDSTFGMAFTSTTLGQGDATLDAGRIFNQGNITAGGNATDVVGISIFGRSERQGKTTVRVDALTNKSAITIDGNTATNGKKAIAIEVAGEATGPGDAYVRVGRITNAKGSRIDVRGKKSESIRGVSLQSIATGAGNAHLEVGRVTNRGAITVGSESADPIAMNFYGKSDGKGNATLHITGDIINEASGAISSPKSSVSFDTKSGNTTGNSRIIVDGRLINKGKIESEDGDAIYVGLNTKITGGIINTGVIQGETAAIYVENDDSAIVPTIDLAGNSARVIGAIDAPNSVLTLRGQSSKNPFAPEGDFYVADFIIDPSGVMEITNDGHHLEVGNLFRNRGTLRVPASKVAKITGNYAQTDAGRYIAGIDAEGQSITYGRLDITGDVSLNNKMRLNIAKGATDILKAKKGETITIGNVLTYGGAATGADAIEVASKRGLLFDFSAANDKSGNIRLGATVLASSYTEGLLLSRNTDGGADVLDIATALGSVLDAADAAGGLSDDLDDVVEKLGNLKGRKRVKALEEIKTTSTVTVGSGVAIRAGNGFGSVMRNRIAALTGSNDMTTGFAAGDLLEDVSWWSQPYGGIGSQDDKGGVAGYDMNSRGLVLGVDKAVSPQWRAGLAFSYANTDVDTNTGAQSVDIDTYQVGAYGTRELAPDIRLNLQTGIGWARYDSRRVIPSLGKLAEVSYDGANFMGGVSLEKDYRTSVDTMTRAILSAEYNYADVDGYAENGAGAIGLKVSETDQDSLILGIGGEYQYAPSGTGVFSLRGTLGYDALAEQSSVRTQLVAGGTAFSTKGMEPERFLFRGGFGYEFKLEDNIGIDARYDTELRRGFDNHAASVKLKYVY
uniref:Outer membrane autotransporter barrel domain-containing protein n=1 Tax=Candidatus Kentrum sp. TC TaxID=2126339 RepID=A0A450YFP5_9GAMM|nr:MAG: outer membrane autotransporter barrel domain-containing protein [Candidatus Kentron sp. TC]